MGKYVCLKILKDLTIVRVGVVWTLFGLIAGGIFGRVRRDKAAGHVLAPAGGIYRSAAGAVSKAGLE